MVLRPQLCHLGKDLNFTEPLCLENLAASSTELLGVGGWVGDADRGTQHGAWLSGGPLTVVLQAKEALATCVTAATAGEK